VNASDKQKSEDYQMAHTHIHPRNGCRLRGRAVNIEDESDRERSKGLSQVPSTSIRSPKVVTHAGRAATAGARMREELRSVVRQYRAPTPVHGPSGPTRNNFSASRIQAEVFERTSEHAKVLKLHERTTRFSSVQNRSGYCICFDMRS
jgi:hypothetical protein